MPRFTPDMAAADSAVPVYPKGLYQVKIISHTPRVFLNRNDEVRAAVDYRLEMVGLIDAKGKVQSKDADGTNLEGRPVRRHTLWLHTEKTESMNKQFLMAAMGWNPRDAAQEKEANETFFSAHEQWIDGEPEGEVTCGDVYEQPEGRLVNVYLDIELYEDNEQQTFSNWQPAA